MKLGNISLRFLSVILGIVAFGFYVFVIVNFTDGGILEFPYILLTVYFALCTITYPFISLIDHKGFKVFRFLPGSSVLLLNFTISPYIFYKYYMSNETTQEDSSE